MTMIKLPPLPPMQFPASLEDFRAIQIEAMRAALEAAAKLKADALEIFNSNPAMTPQETRDVIEWYDGSIRALRIEGETP